MNMLLVMVIIFVVLLVIGMPLAFTIGISSFAFFLFSGDTPLLIPVQRMISATQSFPLLAMPFFVMAGNLMNAAGITKRLIKFSTVLTGHMLGGMAQVSIVLSTLMGGISGSANADAAMESRMLGPAMLERGYSKGYTSAAIGLSSLITAIIPPSVGLIIYGFVGEVSIGRLFVAGIIPGLMLTIALMVVAALIAKKRDYKAVHEKKASLKDVAVSMKESIWALLFPVLLIVGIRSGVFTPSEGGAFAVVYALIIGVFVYKELTIQKFKNVLRQSLMDNGVIMFIIICSGIFGYLVTAEQIPQSVAILILTVSQNPIIMMFIILSFIFTCGLFMEATVNNLILTPIFLPIVLKLGYDPVHFGIIMMILIVMGGMTPPVGVTMYTVCSIIECPVDQYIKESYPFVIAVLIVVTLLVLVPQITLFLPNLIFN